MADEAKQPSPPTGVDAERDRIIDAHELFRDKREVRIELDGVLYRLRITRRNKLILQK